MQQYLHLIWEQNAVTNLCGLILNHEMIPGVPKHRTQRTVAVYLSLHDLLGVKAFFASNIVALHGLHKGFFFLLFGNILFALLAYTFLKDVTSKYNTPLYYDRCQRPRFCCEIGKWSGVCPFHIHMSEQETNANKLIKCHASILAPASMRCMKCYRMITALSSN